MAERDERNGADSGEASGTIDDERGRGSSQGRPDWTRRIEVTAAVLAGLATVFSGVAAAVALQVQARQGASEVDVTRQGQLTDRFNVAVGNLGDDADEVRLGGIFALRRIMEDSPRDQPAVVDVLSAYVRTHAPTAGEGKAKRDAGGRPAPDVRAAFEALVHRNPEHDESGRVDLRDAHLRYVGPREDLTSGGGRERSRLANANLSGSVLSDAHLSRAELSGTYLVGTRLEDADLREADLRDADLRGAKLSGADLKGADLRGARLRADDPTDDGKSGSGEGAGSAQPAEVSVDQLLQARLDHTTLLPAYLEDDPRIKKHL